MPPQPKETENQPFLDKYSDDPTENEPQLPHPYQQALSRRTKILSHTLVFLLTSSLWLIIILLLSPKALFPSHKPSAPGDPNHNITSNARLLTCGTTPAQALAAGCKYDILLNAFVPNPCYDDEFILEYTDDSSWGAYSDANLTILLSVQQMSESEYYYTSVRDHKNHCGILWKKQFFALFEEGRAIDTIVASAGHTDHCAQYLMDVEESKVDEATRVERGFAGCWIRD
ncbi:hypothetical protein E2P81_ATG11344 [Venturia nashicola]|uniref:Uncharacterized protein n=1 Tax=Venturia nashicola TaxID=86259 RepID=A0A4Z1P443_9PEZI|nr:hypothetical protein E6O75_ATG11032 [Venturia nashicola]TLD35225.1 hypothetical protein E2P81_ATG11344 [Venturia nashicola]